MPPPSAVMRPGADRPRLFLVDGYALIYRAFFALISRPLTTSRGENTSAAWGIVNFLQRLLQVHKPEYLGWVHDSGLSFRHERYPAYKATREKLTEELQADFDRGMERIAAILEANQIPILSLAGYEADDVIGTLARQAVETDVNVVIVSGDKDFQQLVRPGVWLLNPGRGGPASVEEHWVGVENGAERLGVPPALVTDYLALVGDTSDNIPGVRGIGDKTAQELVTQYGPLESILAHVAEITKKRPREALIEHRDLAILSKELVTIRDDLPIELRLDALRIREPYLGETSGSLRRARVPHAGEADRRAGGAGRDRRLPLAERRRPSATSTVDDLGCHVSRRRPRARGTLSRHRCASHPRCRRPGGRGSAAVVHCWHCGLVRTGRGVLLPADSPAADARARRASARRRRPRSNRSASSQPRKAAKRSYDRGGTREHRGTRACHISAARSQPSSPHRPGHAAARRAARRRIGPQNGAQRQVRSARPSGRRCGAAGTGLRHDDRELRP